MFTGRLARILSLDSVRGVPRGVQACNPRCLQSFYIVLLHTNLMLRLFTRKECLSAW